MRCAFVCESLTAVEESAAACAQSKDILKSLMEGKRIGLLVTGAGAYEENAEGMFVAFLESLDDADAHALIRQKDIADP